MAYLDKKVIVNKIKQDDDLLLKGVLGSQTLAQIIEYLQVAIESDAVNCAALLLEYRKNCFPKYADVNDLSLE